MDPVALLVVQTVKSAVDSKGLRCYRNCMLKESDVMRVVALVRKEAPDVESFERDVLRAWSDEVLGHDGLKYPNPVGRIERWAAGEIPKWAQIKRARKVDGEIAARSGSETVEKLAIRAKGGRMVYVWEGRDLSREEAATWHEDRGLPIPRELEQALLEAS